MFVMIHVFTGKPCCEAMMNRFLPAVPGSLRNLRRWGSSSTTKRIKRICLVISRKRCAILIVILKVIICSGSIVCKQLPYQPCILTCEDHREEHHRFWGSHFFKKLIVLKLWWIHPFFHEIWRGEKTNYIMAAIKDGTCYTLERLVTLSTTRIDMKWHEPCSFHQQLQVFLNPPQHSQVRTTALQEEQVQRLVVIWTGNMFISEFSRQVKS